MYFFPLDLMFFCLLKSHSNSSNFALSKVSTPQITWHNLPELIKLLGEKTSSLSLWFIVISVLNELCDGSSKQMGLIQAHHTRGVGGEELLVLTAHLIRLHVV